MPSEPPKPPETPRTSPRIDLTKPPPLRSNQNPRTGLEAPSLRRLGKRFIKAGILTSAALQPGVPVGSAVMLWVEEVDPVAGWICVAPTEVEKSDGSIRALLKQLQWVPLSTFICLWCNTPSKPMMIGTEVTTALGRLS